jgi:glycosyltransferase involved in cell wall biosynthesis
MAAERGLADAYRLVPAVDNAGMPLFYDLADVVVSVPSSDGFPVTVLEASACAAPLVVSGLTYCAEWFENGENENGLVVPVRDAGALSEGVIALCADAERRRRIGAAGRRLVEARADYRRCMDQLETVYQELLASNTRRKDS